MTHAYQEIYLSNAQAALGDAFDYAIRVCGVPGENFIKLFTVSSVSKHMENGEPAYLAGKSGIELAAQILAETTGMTEQPEQPERYARSCEYWIGWAVAYYQWYSGRKYSEIFEVLSFEELEKMYYTLHEADVSKFAEIADARIREHFAETNLKRIRNAFEGVLTGKGLTFGGSLARTEATGYGLFASRAGEKIRRRPALHPAVRTAAKGHQQGKRGEFV